MNANSLIISIDATGNGSLTLTIPRSVFGSEKQNGDDDTFIILIDGIEHAYQESVAPADSRMITINFEVGDSDIEIIRTYLVL